MKKEDNEHKSDTTVAGIICRWYVCAVIGFVVGRAIGDSLTGLIGFAIGAFIGELLRKNLHEKE